MKKSVNESSIKICIPFSQYTEKWASCYKKFAHANTDTTCTWKGKSLKIPASLTLATCNVYCLAYTTLSRHNTWIGKSTVESIT